MAWLHTDDHCPRRPLLGRRPWRSWECRCGRIWRWALHDAPAGFGFYDWKLTKSPKE